MKLPVEMQQLLAAHPDVHVWLSLRGRSDYLIGSYAISAQQPLSPTVIALLQLMGDDDGCTYSTPVMVTSRMLGASLVNVSVQVETGPYFHTDRFHVSGWTPGTPLANGRTVDGPLTAQATAMAELLTAVERTIPPDMDLAVLEQALRLHVTYEEVVPQEFGFSTTDFSDATKNLTLGYVNSFTVPPKGVTRK